MGRQSLPGDQRQGLWERIGLVGRGDLPIRSGPCSRSSAPHLSVCPRTPLSPLPPEALCCCQGLPRSWLIACRHRFTVCFFCSWPCNRFGDKANRFRASHASCPFHTYLYVLDRKARFSVLSDHWTSGATLQSDFSHRSE